MLSLSKAFLLLRAITYENPISSSSYVHDTNLIVPARECGTRTPSGRGGRGMGPLARWGRGSWHLGVTAARSENIAGLDGEIRHSLSK